MNVVSVCLTYPSRARPWRGAFVRRRLQAMARRMSVRVVAPRPWLEPAQAALRDEVNNDDLEQPAIETRRPALFSVPGLLKAAEPWLYSRTICREVRSLDYGHRPDLLDAHFEWPDGPAAVRAGARLNLPVVVTLRGKIVSHSRYARRKAQMRDMLRRADARIAVSRDLARRAEALADDGRPVHVIPNGIDSQRFQPRDRAAVRAKLRLDRHARYLISVGHLQELKGFHRLVEMLPRVRAVCGDVRLLLLGGGVGETAYVQRLDGRIAALGLTHCVLRLGRLAPDETALLLAASDLFVLASRSEGWCNAIHESLACGTPVIATDVGGNRELVRCEEDGTLVPFGDRAALGDAVVRGLAAIWPREQIAARAAARSWDDVAREVQDVFTDVLERRCTRPS